MLLTGSNPVDKLPFRLHENAAGFLAHCRSSWVMPHYPRIYADKKPVRYHSKTKNMYLGAIKTIL